MVAVLRLQHGCVVSIYLSDRQTDRQPGRQRGGWACLAAEGLLVQAGIDGTPPGSTTLTPTTPKQAEREGRRELGRERQRERGCLAESVRIPCIWCVASSS